MSIFTHLTVVLSCGQARETRLYVLDTAMPLRGTPRLSETLPGHTSFAVAATGHAAGTWELTLTARECWPEPLNIEIRFKAVVPLTHFTLPKFTGQFERSPFSTAPASFFRGAGSPPSTTMLEPRLALPAAIVEFGGRHWLIGTDPLHSAMFATTAPGNEVIISWTLLPAAGVHAHEVRRLFVSPIANERQALDDWFKFATPDVPAGPAWLHDIALQNYDYFSKNGDGWCRDIDAAAAFIPPEQRHRALFCLHGWYDQVGVYCYDPEADQLRERWTVFSEISNPELLKLEFPAGTAHTRWPGTPTLDTHVWRNLSKYRPVCLDWDEIRRRLAYARDRGFRTAFYVMCGLQLPRPNDSACDDQLLVRDFGGWQGPDSLGPTSLLNPLHPQVRRRIKAYVSRLLEKVGDLSDAFVMDEAYYIGTGMLGTTCCPGYADRAQFTLIQELADLCHTFRPDLAFLTADYLGASWMEEKPFPYSLAADGIYQDTICWPMTWDQVRFPAWRNVAWSCNWAPVNNIKFTRWGVVAHDATVALGHGCWGDDLGLADMPSSARDELIALWKFRSSRSREKPVIVVNRS